MRAHVPDRQFPDKGRSGGNRRSADLTHVAGTWPTPLARDWKGTNSPEHVRQLPPARNHMEQLANFAVYSRQARTISGDGEATCDQRRSLNPAFVEALMGWAHRVGRLRLCGNGVVLLVAAHAFRILAARFSD